MSDMELIEKALEDAARVSNEGGPDQIIFTSKEQVLTFIQGVLNCDLEEAEEGFQTLVDAGRLYESEIQ